MNQISCKYQNCISDSSVYLSCTFCHRSYHHECLTSAMNRHQVSDLADIDEFLDKEAIFCSLTCMMDYCVRAVNSFNDRKKKKKELLNRELTMCDKIEAKEEKKYLK